MDVILLEIKDIKGNSLIKGMTNQITLLSLSHGVSLPMQHDVSQSNRTMGKPIFQEINCSKESDLATPVLYDYCTQGKTMGNVKIHVGRNENDTYMPLLEYVLFDAFISNISTSVGGPPHDSFSINFTKITMDYTVQKPDSSNKGKTSYVWNLKTNSTKDS